MLTEQRPTSTNYNNMPCILTQQSTNTNSNMSRTGVGYPPDNPHFDTAAEIDILNSSLHSTTLS